MDSILIFFGKVYDNRLILLLAIFLVTALIAKSFSNEVDRLKCEVLELKKKLAENTPKAKEEKISNYNAENDIDREYFLSEIIEDFDAIEDPDNQLRFVVEGNLSKYSLLNEKERDLMKILEQEIPKSTQLAMQPCLGEFLCQKNKTSDKDKKAYKSINSKRADFLVVGESSKKPYLMIEYHGSGHWGKDREATKKRDKVKEIACKNAELPLLIISEKYTKNLVKEGIRKFLPEGYGKGKYKYRQT